MRFGWCCARAWSASSTVLRSRSLPASPRWPGSGSPGLRVVIGLAIICNLVAGALGGILIPMVLERVRADPAVASGTFVTTVTDVVGFFSFLGIATLWFGLK